MNQEFKFLTPLLILSSSFSPMLAHMSWTLVSPWYYIQFLFVKNHDGSGGKESACNVGDLASIPGSGRSPGEGNGNPLQYSFLENPMDRGTWRAMTLWTWRSMDSQGVGHDWVTNTFTFVLYKYILYLWYIKLFYMTLLNWDLFLFSFFYTLKHFARGYFLSL